MYARRLGSIVQMKMKDRIAVIGEGLPLIAENALACGTGEAVSCR